MTGGLEGWGPARVIYLVNTSHVRDRFITAVIDLKTTGGAHSILKFRTTLIRSMWYVWDFLVVMKETDVLYKMTF